MGGGGLYRGEKDMAVIRESSAGTNAHWRAITVQYLTEKSEVGKGKNLCWEYRLTGGQGSEGKKRNRKENTKKGEIQVCP